jgi:soluble lytic murein transglycosylase-like protein
MSRIVFAKDLRKTLNAGADKAPLYARKSIWIPLVLFNIALAIAFGMSWRMDTVWSVLPQAKAYAIPAPAIERQSVQQIPAKPEALDKRAQKAAEYIATTYHIAREASELIVRESVKAGKANSVDPILILAIIGVESRFNPISESQAGALGLTQTMAEYHPEKVAKIVSEQGHILNIADNIQLGSKIIGEYMRKYGNNETLALQQYNGSLNDKSRAYSNRVLELKSKFDKASS